MQKRVLLAIFLLVLIMVGGVAQLLTRKAKPPVLVSRTDPPKISFEEKLHDLGSVDEGNEIPYVFKIHNVGGESLVINDVNSTCDCTLLNLKDKYIEPGKTGDLEVILDTTRKHGYLKKEIDIFSNDPRHPKASIFLAADILPSTTPPPKDTGVKKNALTPFKTISMANPHAGMTNAMRGHIFTGQCATCHVAQGKGKTRGDLFQADCAMCHGQNAEGGIGPALVPGNYHDQDFMNRVQKTVRYGSDHHYAMPGFLKEAGGPLTDAEINSIVQYLQNKSDQTRGRQHDDIPGG